jgi:hypothetical protein
MTDTIRPYVIPCLHPRQTARVWWYGAGQTYTARIDNMKVDGVGAPEGTLTVWFGTRVGELPTVEALQVAISANAVIPPTVRTTLQRDAAVSIDEPSASWPAGQPSRELISELLAADHDLSQGRAALRGLLMLIGLLVAAVVAVAIVVTLGG